MENAQQIIALLQGIYTELSIVIAILVAWIFLYIIKH
jgi:hypothetical protein